MTHSVQKLLASALALPDEEQLELFSALQASFDERELRPFNDAWLTEIQRRSAEVDAGTAQLTPWAEVRERV